MLPILLEAVVGYAVAIPLGLVDFLTFGQEAILRLPQFTLPVFNDPLTLTFILGVGVMAIAIVPESKAHLYQISLYVEDLAEQKGEEKYHLDEHIGFNLILDGIDDLINGLLGSPQAQTMAKKTR